MEASCRPATRATCQGPNSATAYSTPGCSPRSCCPRCEHYLIFLSDAKYFPEVVSLYPAYRGVECGAGETRLRAKLRIDSMYHLTAAERDRCGCGD